MRNITSLLLLLGLRTCTQKSSEILAVPLENRNRTSTQVVESINWLKVAGPDMGSERRTGNRINELAKGVVTVGTKKAIFLVAVLFVGILSTSCVGPLTQAKAIAKVVEKHPGFPAEPGKVNRSEVPIGGRKGNTAKVDLTTAVEPCGRDSYMVTLTKNWNLTINDTPIVSTWKYKVDKGSVTLIESHDMDAAVTVIK